MDKIQVPGQKIYGGHQGMEEFILLPGYPILPTEDPEITLRAVVNVNAKWPKPILLIPCRFILEEPK